MYTYVCSLYKSFSLFCFSQTERGHWALRDGIESSSRPTADPRRRDSGEVQLHLYRWGDLPTAARDCFYSQLLNGDKIYSHRAPDTHLCSGREASSKCEDFILSPCVWFVWLQYNMSCVLKCIWKRRFVMTKLKLLKAYLRCLWTFSLLMFTSRIYLFNHIVVQNLDDWSLRSFWNVVIKELNVKTNQWLIFDNPKPLYYTLYF